MKEGAGRGGGREKRSLRQEEREIGGWKGGMKGVWGKGAGRKMQQSGKQTESCCCHS